MMFIIQVVVKFFGTAVRFKSFHVHILAPAHHLSALLADFFNVNDILSVRFVSRLSRIPSFRILSMQRRISRCSLSVNVMLERVIVRRLSITHPLYCRHVLQLLRTKQAACRCRLLLRLHLPLVPGRRPRVLGHALRRLLSAAEQLHLLHDYLGLVYSLTIHLPRPRSYLALDENLGPLPDVLLDDVRKPPPCNDVMPFRLLLDAAVLGLVPLCRRQRKLRNLRPLGCCQVLNLRILPCMAYQKNFIQ